MAPTALRNTVAADGSIACRQHVAADGWIACKATPSLLMAWIVCKATPLLPMARIVCKATPSLLMARIVCKATPLLPMVADRLQGNTATRRWFRSSEQQPHRLNEWLYRSPDKNRPDQSVLCLG
jgi:hypothetical protein